MVGDSQLRWLGPEKGVMHMAIGAVVNAAWDLAAKVAGKPVWRLLADMTPEQLVACVDFRYIDDALSPAQPEITEVVRTDDRLVPLLLPVGEGLLAAVRK